MQVSVRNIIELGSAVREARLRQGLTQAQLAERAQVSRSFVIGLEAGSKSGAELGRVFSVIKALGLKLQLTVDDSSGYAQALQQIIGQDLDLPTYGAGQ